MKNKQHLKTELDKRIMSCRKCPGLNIPEETMAAPGYGAIDAELFCVGQSLHGYNPNTPERQIPFVGPIKSSDCGVLLYKCLADAGYGYHKDNLYISNVVSCHTPNNRSSRIHEVINCTKFLQEELALVEPSIVMALGVDARNWFKLPKLKGSKLVDYICIRKGVHYIVAVHPSYIMNYTEGKEEQYMNEFKEALFTYRRPK